MDAIIKPFFYMVFGDQILPNMSNIAVVESAIIPAKNTTIFIEGASYLVTKVYINDKLCDIETSRSNELVYCYVKHLKQIAQ